MSIPTLQHFRQNFVQRLAVVCQQVGLGKAQMPACLAALDDHKVGTRAAPSA